MGTPFRKQQMKYQNTIIHLLSSLIHQPHCDAMPKRFSTSDAGQAPNTTYSH
jgi:hypothetical protein